MRGLIAQEGIHIGPRERDAHGTTGNPGGLRRKGFVRPDHALYAKRATGVLRDHPHRCGWNAEERGRPCCTANTCCVES